jgi:hypothetical protein
MYGGDFSGGRIFDDAFWTGSQSQAIALRSWLLREDTLQRIARAAHLLRSDGFEHLFWPAFASLEGEASA